MELIETKQYQIVSFIFYVGNSSLLTLHDIVYKCNYCTWEYIWWIKAFFLTLPWKKPCMNNQVSNRLKTQVCLSFFSHTSWKKPCMNNQVSNTDSRLKCAIVSSKVSNTDSGVPWFLYCFKPYFSDLHQRPKMLASYMSELEMPLRCVKSGQVYIWYTFYMNWQISNSRTINNVKQKRNCINTVTHSDIMF